MIYVFVYPDKITKISEGRDIYVYYLSFIFLFSHS